jgi:hypothetical protein
MKTQPSRTGVNRAASAIITTISLMAFGTVPVAVAESWELRTAAQEVKGTRAIEAGQLDKGIAITQANYGTTPYREKGAMLTNLCVAYILKHDFETAGDYCDRAVKRGFNDREAHNNRGVLRAMQSDYQGAVDDFEKAGCLADCSQALDTTGNERMHVARRNLQRVEVRIAQQEQSERELQLVTRNQ